ncbi:hypothetical protein LCGC14_2714570, partial [marine sediment metagenome]
MFLRWAPGFEGSDIQPTILPAGNTNAMTAAALTNHDPFDTRQLDNTAYHLHPLIYSGGPDKKYDLEVNKPHEFDGDPYASGAGAPKDDSDNPDGELNHYDNIHNHRIEQK